MDEEQSCSQCAEYYRNKLTAQISAVVQLKADYAKPFVAQLLKNGKLALAGKSESWPLSSSLPKDQREDSNKSNMTDEAILNAREGFTPENFEAYQNALFAALGEVTKASQFLSPTELGFYKASSPDFEDRLANVGEQLLGLCNVFLVHSGGVASDRGVVFEDVDELTDRFATVVDTVDNLLEKADVCLDEVTGRIKKNAPGNVPGQGEAVIMQVEKNNRLHNVVHAQNILRPQLKFDDKIDNSNRPFVRKITHKPNALRPLDYGMPGSGDISPEMGDHLRTLGITDASSSRYSLPHPYEYEIQNIEYPAHMFEARPEQLYAPMEQTPFTWVDTEEKLRELARLLESATEIAVDTEHHDYRSFQGFVCLVQISTRNEDFIIDTLAVRSHMHVLNSSFTNPNIVKVFHGAESDIQWIQRDFGLYIVNLFDTYHASHVLEMASHGLAYLLKYYCSVETDKKYQLADWRIRPLPAEMLKYARSDTHYLLYIYDRMRNELLNLSNPETHNLLRATLERSAQTALKKYEKEIYDSDNGEGPSGWRNALRKYGGSLNAEQFAVFRAIHTWRDHIAREEDESPRYVLPNHMLHSLVVRMPTDAQGILGSCSPPPPLVRLYATDLALLIETAVIEARRTKENQEAMLKRIREEEAEREKIFQERKAKGPLHIRFEDMEDGAANGSPATVLPIVEALPASTLFGTAKDTVEGRPKIQRVTVTAYSIFGSGSDDSEADEDKNARRLAQEIRRTLYLVAPTPKVSLKRKRQMSASELQPVPAVTRAVAPAVSTPLSDISDSVSPQARVTTATPAIANESSMDVITIEDEDVEVVNVKAKTKKKKKKGKRNKSGGSTPQSPAGSPGKFKPFDYSKAKSVIGASMGAHAVDEDGAINLNSDEEGERPRNNRQKKQAKGGKFFNPYGAGGSDRKEKQDPRANLRPKSGNRSGTFARNT